MLADESVSNSSFNSTLDTVVRSNMDSRNQIKTLTAKKIKLIINLLNSKTSCPGTHPKSRAKICPEFTVTVLTLFGADLAHNEPNKPFYLGHTYKAKNIKN
jgi:hypothetical protein